MKGTRFLIDDKRNTALLRVWEKNNLKQYWKKNNKYLNYAESKVSLFLGTQKRTKKCIICRLTFTLNGTVK